MVGVANVGQGLLRFGVRRMVVDEVESGGWGLGASGLGEIMTATAVVSVVTHVWITPALGRLRDSSLTSLELMQGSLMASALACVVLAVEPTRIGALIASATQAIGEGVFAAESGALIANSVAHAERGSVNALTSTLTAFTWLIAPRLVVHLRDSILIEGVALVCALLLLAAALIAGVWLNDVRLHDTHVPPPRSISAPAAAVHPSTTTRPVTPIRKRKEM
jgi:hypothetical protein